MSLDMQDLSAQTLPIHMKFSEMTPLAVSATSKRTKFLPTTGGIYTPNNNILRIPISSSTDFLDGSGTVLKFTYKNTTAQTITFDGSAHSCIQSLRLISTTSGQELELIRNYSQLHNMLSDLVMGPQQRFAKSYEGYGYQGVLGPSTDVNGALVVVASAVKGATSEDQLGCNEVKIATTQSHTFMLPLLSSIIGQGQKRYFPLYLSGALMLEIEFASSFLPFVSSTAAALAYEISNCELQTTCIQFGGDVNKQLFTMVERAGLYLHTNTWATYYNAINDANQNIQINERLKSVKSVFLTFSKIPLDSLERYHARTHANVTRLQLKAGSLFLPPQALSATDSTAKNNCEFIVSTLGAIGEFQNPNHFSLMNSATFASEGNLIGSCGRAVYGLDCDAFTRANVESGLNLVNNSPLNIIVTQSAGAAYNSFVYLLYDAVYTILPNGSCVKSC